MFLKAFPCCWPTFDQISNGHIQRFGTQVQLGSIQVHFLMLRLTLLWNWSNAMCFFSIPFHVQTLTCCHSTHLIVFVMPQPFPPNNLGHSMSRSLRFLTSQATVDIKISQPQIQPHIQGFI